MVRSPTLVNKQEAIFMCLIPFQDYATIMDYYPPLLRYDHYEPEVFMYIGHCLFLLAILYINNHVPYYIIWPVPVIQYYAILKVTYAYMIMHNIIYNLQHSKYLIYPNRKRYVGVRQVTGGV